MKAEAVESPREAGLDAFMASLVDVQSKVKELQAKYPDPSSIPKTALVPAEDEEISVRRQVRRLEEKTKSEADKKKDSERKKEGKEKDSERRREGKEKDSDKRREGKTRGGARHKDKERDKAPALASVSEVQSPDPSALPKAPAPAAGSNPLFGSMQAWGSTA